MSGKSPEYDTELDMLRMEVISAVGQTQEALEKLSERDAYISQLEESVSSLTADLEDERTDAARYRWLRRRADNYTTEWDHVEFSWRIGQRTIMVPPSNADVDAAIDEAMVVSSEEQAERIIEQHRNLLKEGDDV